jgi:hypothetical protein
MMTGVKDYTESGKIKSVLWRNKPVDPTKLAGCYGDLRKNGFQKAFGDTSMPEIEDHEEST